MSITMKTECLTGLLLGAVALSLPACASTPQEKNFQLNSQDISPLRMMANKQEYNSFGCNGSNVSPAISWTGAPPGTKSFALMVYDPNAPTGSGFWQWQMINIPASETSLKEGAGDVNRKVAPKGAVQMRNDYGFYGYGGPCPPQGSVHLYEFVLHALDVDKVSVPKDASGALTGYVVNAHTIDTATITAPFARGL
ncbi:MAG: kinase inhibitor [Oceanospirillales bacterium LUC14_002_19_P2]|nr:MAG: kinase inhibitor [Oceanospirillales bacterium LUC14_002_19_P2]